MKLFLAALTALALPMTAAAQETTVRTDSIDTRQPDAPCAEACLKSVLDRYFAALAKRDPAAAPLAPGARYSENGVMLPFGEGLWRTFDSAGSWRNAFYDDDAGQVGLFTTVVENGTTQLLTLRLKVVDGKVAEAEALVQRRQASRFINTEGLSLDAIWDRPIPESQRNRRKLIAAVDPYFDGLIRGDGSIVPFAEDCWRIENGILTAGIEGRHPRIGATPTGGETRKLMRCREQFDTGTTTYIQSVTPRRYLVVDETRGLVFGIFQFEHPGDRLEGTGKDGVKRKLGEAATRPFSAPVAELFKVVDGRIVAIEAVMITLPYRFPTPW